ncbi:MAG: hypothetical protein WCG05_00970 [Alphaproteobacteria bacterium]
MADPHSTAIFPYQPSNMLIVMLAADTTKFAGSVKVNLPNADFSYSVRLLDRPKFPTVNPVDMVGTGNRFEGGFPEVYSTELHLFVDKSIISAIQNCFGGTNLGTMTIYEVGTGGGGPAVITTRTLYNVFIEAVKFEFNANYELWTSEGMVLTLVLKYPKIDEMRTQYDQDMSAQGNVASSSDTEKAVYGPGTGS